MNNTPIKFFPPYFIQSHDWMSFWKRTNKNHQFYHYQSQYFSTFVFEYKLFRSFKFWYISKGPIFKDIKFHDLDQNVLKKDLNDLIRLIKKNGAAIHGKKLVFLKIDLDDVLAKKLEIQNAEDLPRKLQLKNVISKRKIQYLKSTTSDLTEIIENYKDKEIKIGEEKQEKKLDLTEVYEKTTPFWSACNEKIRRYSRKTLKLYQAGFWQVSTEKTAGNFEDFYKIHSETAKRQNFSTQGKEYLKAMFTEEFSRIIVIRDESGVPHSVWLGVNLNDQLVYLCGGNTDLSFEKWAQYLLHIAAIGICVRDKINFYDMGGYEEKSGYGQFKEGYKGLLRQFIGPIDIVFSPVVYFFYNNLMKLRRVLRK